MWICGHKFSKFLRFAFLYVWRFVGDFFSFLFVPRFFPSRVIHCVCSCFFSPLLFVINGRRRMVAFCYLFVVSFVLSLHLFCFIWHSSCSLYCITSVSLLYMFFFSCLFVSIAFPFQNISASLLFCSPRGFTGKTLNYLGDHLRGAVPRRWSHQWVGNPTKRDSNDSISSRWKRHSCRGTWYKSKNINNFSNVDHSKLLTLQTKPKAKKQWINNSSKAMQYDIARSYFSNKIARHRNNLPAVVSADTINCFKKRIDQHFVASGLNWVYPGVGTQVL